MKPWLTNYPKNINHRVDTSQYNSLTEMLTEAVDTYKNNVAYQNFGAKLSFSDVEKLSRNFAAYLQHQANIKKGDRVALMTPNTLCFPVAMWGILRAGAVQVNVNPLYTARELAHQLTDADVETIIIFSAATPTLAKIIAETSVKQVIVINLDDLINKGLPTPAIDENLENTVLFTDALNQGEKLELQPVDISQQDLAFLQYTGGTTGLSKGAMLTHGNIIANILQYQEFAKNVFEYGKEIVITAIPMYHIFALTANTLCYFYFGAKNILVTNPRDMAAFVEVWRHANATVFTGVNTLFNGLLHTPGFADLDFSSLKLCIGGGAAVQQAVADKWQQVTGVRLNEGYGLSETSPILTLNFGNEQEYVPGIGVPIPNTDISIRDDDGNELPQGESGELCAKGPQIMAGYWRAPEATANAMTKDGYFKTGDIALLDNKGFFHIVDRKKDMILVSGFNVYPNEIEAEIAKMPGIIESACIGVDDAKTGEAVKVFVVKKDPHITAQDVIDFCAQNLTAYKIPKQVVFIDEIPKSSVGKLLRRELR